MFVLSEKVTTCFANALYTIAWRGLLEQFGLASEQEYAEMKYLADPEIEADFDSWSNLKSHLDSASPESLRLLCSHVLRNKEGLAQASTIDSSFRDHLAHFEVALEEDGYTFDGFQVCKKQIAVAQLADEELNRALDSGDVPLGELFKKHFAAAQKYISNKQHTDGMTNLRLALKYALQEIAEKLALRRGDALPSMREEDVRDYLRRIGFFSEEEKRGFSGIYGLLSAGPHGSPTDSISLLGYAACIMACVYALNKYKDIT